MAFKVGGCAGHGGYMTLVPKTYATAGKRTPDGEPEWIFNDKVICAFEEELSKYEDVEFKRFDDPTGKTDVPLKTRTDNANAWGADIYISFHHNANTGRWGNWTGTETFTQTGVGGKALELAKLVQPALVKAYGLRDRGLKTANFHITRETKMPAVLIEGGYMDSLIDIVKMRDDITLENAGRFVAQAVAEFANLKLKEKPMVKSVIIKGEKPKSHTVEKGDTFYSVAKKFGFTVKQIEEFNPRVDSSKLQIGDVIHLVPFPDQPKVESKPVEKKPAPKPQPKPKKKYVVLPASNDSWRVYPTNKAPVKGNESGYLNPKKFNGLTYEVLGSPQANVVTIQSSNFGRVNIFVAQSTGAKFIWK